MMGQMMIVNHAIQIVLNVKGIRLIVKVYIYYTW